MDDALFDDRYSAVSARDSRFDGQFITGVFSTGIYCRPSCPARTPQRKNVTFFVTAAAAHEAGLRACKRCLPDAVPGSPDWNLRDDLSSRAMKLIDDGLVDRAGVGGLARALGYSERHLGRVLRSTLGAGPLALARAHRARDARILLGSPSLSITQVAFASGFSSIRAFNDTISEVYRLSPTELRAAVVGTSVSSQPQELPIPALTLRLPAREPFDGMGVLDFLNERCVGGIEAADALSYTRTLRLPESHAVVRVEPEAAGITVTAWLADLRDTAPLVARVRHLFDLDADSQAVTSALAKDPRLRVLATRFAGIRMPGTLEPHELVFRALIGQQISVLAARRALSTLVAELGELCAVPHPEVSRIFPTAQAIALHGRSLLRGPERRISTIIDVAERLASGELVVDQRQSVGELRASLEAVPGIGPWTSGYIAMRVLGATDVLLDGDLVVRKAAAAYGLGETARELRAECRGWAPWRSYGTMLMWRAARESPEKLEKTAEAQA